MYFNRKNAEQKNWRMIKKGKHFLFGCSLVFAVGAALVAPSVKADAVEAKPEASSTAEGVKPAAAEEKTTYAAPAVEVAPAAVAGEKVETTQNSKEEPVVAPEKAKEADSIQAPEVTVVYNPSALTDEEKAKVVAAVKAANSKATDVQVQADGSVVVNFADGSSARLSAAQTIKDGSQVAKSRRVRAAVAAPVITSNLDGKGSSATDVTVQAPAGSTVKLYNNDGVVIGQAVANAQGVATVTPTNSLPVGEITATATPAGESESPKSAPVTATRPTLTTVEGGVSRGNDSDNTQLLVTKSHITVYPGESVKIGVVAVSKEMENFSVPKNPDGVKGLLPRGVFLKSGGKGEDVEPVKRRNNGYGGTVDWDQPAGDTVVTFSVRSKNNVVVTRDLKVTVLELTKKLDAVPGEKVEVADLNNVSEDEKNKIIAATKKANASFPPGTLYNVDQRGNLVVTYPDKSTDKIDASYLVTPSNKPADTNKPAGQAPEITSDLSGKASTPTDVTVKAEPGSTVKLYNNDGVVIGEAVANDQGIATISPINSLPEGQITATATPAGGSESPKSTPITATRAEKPEVDGGVSRGNDNTQLLVTRSHITVYPGESVNVGVTAASNAIQNFWVPNNPTAVKGLKPTGYYISTAGTDTIRQRSAGYGGTVDWDQPAGDTVVTFAVRSKKNAVVTRDLKVTVLELTKKLDAVPGEKVEVANPNNVSEEEKNKIIAATTKANASFPPGTTYSVDEKGNLVITYPDKSTDKIAAAYLVTPAARETDKYTPTAKNQTVKQGETPDAKGSIDNAGELPSGTTFAYKTPVDTATKGEKDAIVVVTYPDKSTDEVPVKVTVKDPRSDADKNDPKPKAQDIYKGSTPDAKGSIANAGDLPYGTSFAYKTPVDTETPGEKDATVVVTYPDGSKDEVPVKVTVEDPDKTSAENNTPIAKDQTVKVGEEPKAEASIGNFDKLPKGTKAEFKTPVDTTTPGEKDAIVVVTYPDSLTYEVPVKVTVKDPRSDADKNDPKAKAQDVNKGETPDAKGSIDNVGELPNGTTFAYKTPVDTETPGEKDATVVVTYPDKSTDEVPVKVTVKEPSESATDADKYTPKAKAQDVNKGETPDAKGSIDNAGELPNGTTFAYKTPVDTETPGEKDATVVVTYPDKSTDEVPVKVTVKDPRSDADKNDPKAKAQDVNKGETPDAKGSIDNVGELPNGTTFAYKTPVDTETPGEKDATVVVTYPDKSTDEVPVKVTVKEPSESATDADKYTPKAKAQDVNKGETPDAKGSIDNAGELPNGTTFVYKTPVDTETPGEKDATVVVTYPDKSTDEVPVKVTVKEPSESATDADKYTPKAKAQDVNKGETPDAKGSIDNAGELPNGTTFAYKTPVDTETPGEKDATVVVTYPDKSTDEVPVKVTVKEPSESATDADKYTPKAKAQDVNKGETPDAKGSIDNAGELPNGTTFAYKTPVDTETPGEKDATVVVTYPDKSTDEVPVKVTVKDPRTDADKNTPVAKDQSVKPGDKPNAKDSIGNVGDLPSGTKFEYKTPVDTTTEGDKDAIVVVTYPDGSKDEVPVKVTVKEPRTDADKNTPVAKDQSVKPGDKPNAKDSIGNVGDLPSGTKFEYKTPVDTTTEGDKDAIVVVTYPDGSKDEVPVKVTVKDPRTDADKNTPVAKDQSVKPGETPNAKDSIGNVGELPEGTTFEFKTPVDTTTPGDKGTTVVVTYPDGSKDEVPVTVTVKDPDKTSDAENNTPTAKDQTVKQGETPDAKNSIGNVGELPEGTTFEFKTPVDTTTPGDKGTTVVVTYPDGSKDEVPVKVTVKDSSALTQPEITADLTGKAGTKTPVEVTADPGTKVELFDKDGNKIGEGVTGEDGKASITPTVEIPAGPVTAKASKDGKTSDESAPKVATKDPAITPVVNPSALTDAEKAKVADEVKKANPTASKVEVGNDGTATVTFPDGSVAVLTPEKTVKEADSNGVKNPAITPVVNPSALTDAEKAKVADEVKKANPTASKVEVGNDGTATVTFPDGSVAVLTPEKTVKEADSNGVKNPAITPVVNPSALTDAEKAKVADEVKKANPTASKVEVGNDGTATVTFPDGSVAVLTPEKTVKEADSNGVKNPAITPVVNPSALTDAEKAKVADEVKKANPTASKVEVGNDGTATVTFPDGSVAVLTPEKTVKEADSNGVKNPAITPVVNPSALTDAEKAKVADEVKKANPTASKVEVGNDGTATVTFPDGSVAVLTPEKTVKEADSNGVKNPAITPVVNPSALTDAEKAKVADEVKKANPTASKVEVGNDGTATVTFPDGSVAVLTPEKTVKEADSNGVKNPAITPVVNPSALTDAEKAKVADEVKKANPTASKVEVGNDGTATVTFPDGSVAVLTPEKTVKEADSNGVKNPAITPVVNPSALTDAEKAKVADEVKKANPTASKVEVGNDGTATVTFPDGSVAVLTPEKTVKEADSNGVKNPAITPVVNPSALTDAEKAKVADEVKKANPTASKVEVGNDGTATVTFPDGSVAVLTPEKTVKEADSNGVKNPAITPVVNPSALTDAEKAKVADEVKKANPTASKVEVGNDGTATVTFPDGSVAVLTPEKTVKEADSNGVKNPAITPVVNPSALTDAEKAKVADEVKKANPTASKVEVGNDGTATVTFPDGSVAVLTPEKTVKEADSNGVKNPAITPVVNPSALTDAEKAKVADEVKKANPTASKVEVGNDGTATVTFPDGSVAVLTPEKTVKEADSNGVKNPAITPVVNPSALTDAEKAKVADEVKKANPTASKVEVGNDGTATVTFPDGSVAVLTPEKTVKEADSNGVKNPAITPVVNPSALTDAEKAKVADEVKKANPTASKVEVGNDGTATVTFPDGSVAVLTPEKTVKEADSNGVKNPAITPVVNPSALTDAEKAKVADEVKKANPTASKVEVGNDGTATVTFPDGSVAVLTPEKTVKEADSNGVKNPAITPVVNPSALTDAEKAKVADEVKKANPTASKVEVGNDGTATVTFPDGSVAVLTPEKTVKKATKESSANPASKKAGAKELPNTGTEQSNASVGLALLAAATGGLLFAKKRKEEE